MAGVFKIVELLHILEDAISDDFNSTFGNSQLCLFKNDFTPTPAFTPADLVEADFSGYARVDLGTWSHPYTHLGGFATVAQGPYRFFHNGGPVNNVIYGWFIRRISDGAIPCAERLLDIVHLECVARGVIVFPAIGASQFIDVIIRGPGR